jgi:hypothetical protein
MDMKQEADKPLSNEDRNVTRAVEVVIRGGGARRKEGGEDD